LYRVVLTNRAVKGLDAAPPHIQRRVPEVLDALRETFAPVKLFDVKKLKGEDDTFRIRLGGWRVIYELRRKESTIVVLDITSRGSAY